MRANGGTAGETTLTVFAAASLTDAFNEIGEQFKQQYAGVTLEFNFAGSQQLRAQLEQGAIADVFAPANTREMDAAIQSDLVISGTQKTFVRNRLAVIVPNAGPAQAFMGYVLSAAGQTVMQEWGFVPAEP